MQYKCLMQTSTTSPMQTITKYHKPKSEKIAAVTQYFKLAYIFKKYGQPYYIQGGPKKTGPFLKVYNFFI